MMRLTPTKGGGRLLEADTRLARLRVEWDAAGNLISQECEVRAIPDPPPADAGSQSKGCGGCGNPTPEQVEQMRKDGLVQ